MDMTTPTTTTYDQLTEKQSELIRMALKGGIFVRTAREGSRRGYGDVAVGRTDPQREEA
jgi:hypothetical protein